MDVYYPGIAAGDAATIGTDGTVSAIVTPNATYQVYELEDKTFSTPLTIKTPSGLTDTKVPVGNLPILPDVYVVSPNYSHNWKSGDLVFRRDSADAKDKAVATAVAAAQAAVAAVPVKIQEAVASGDFRGPAGKDGANVIPTADVIAAQTIAKPVLSQTENGTPVLTTPSLSVSVLTPETADNKYGPIADAVFIPAKAFDPAGGSMPTYGAVAAGQIWGWLLDDGTIQNGESVVTFFSVPAHWAQAQVELWWAPLTAAGGNSDWQAAIHNVSHTSAFNASGGIVTSGAFPAGSTAARARVSLIASPLAVEPLKKQRLTIIRRTSGTGHANTIVGDIALLGVRVVRYS